ncbi:hypothetical protein DB345_02685 [Spartobacteria bacterium LR76]|nr:hypothetical protein DB345_02685 [Spartobacteria bacterium LR76]
MKNRFALFLAVLALATGCGAGRAAEFVECEIRSVVAAALPDYVIVGGDRAWAGGMNSNAMPGGVTLDTNSAFILVESREKREAGTAEQIAMRIRERIIADFHLPVTKPSSMWGTHQPEGTTKETYGEVYLHTYPKDNDWAKVNLYVTVQAVRIAEGRFGVTVNYVQVGR